MRYDIERLAKEVEKEKWHQATFLRLHYFDAVSKRLTRPAGRKNAIRQIPEETPTEVEANESKNRTGRGEQTGQRGQK